MLIRHTAFSAMRSHTWAFDMSAGETEQWAVEHHVGLVKKFHVKYNARVELLPAALVVLRRRRCYNKMFLQ